MSTDALVIRAASAPSLLYAVKQVELAIKHHLDELLRPAGITTAQYTALTVLAQRDDQDQGLSSAELARRSFVTAQSMGDMITALEQRGLIQRDPDPGNRRRRLISITPAGQALMASQHAAVQTLERLMISGLDAEQVRELRKTLNSCRTALTRDHR